MTVHHHLIRLNLIYRVEYLLLRDMVCVCSAFSHLVFKKFLFLKKCFDILQHIYVNTK